MRGICQELRLRVVQLIDMVEHGVEVGGHFRHFRIHLRDINTRGTVVFDDHAGGGGYGIVAFKGSGDQEPPHRLRESENKERTTHIGRKSCIQISIIFR